MAFFPASPARGEDDDDDDDDGGEASERDRRDAAGAVVVVTGVVARRMIVPCTSRRVVANIVFGGLDEGSWHGGGEATAMIWELRCFTDDVGFTSCWP